jgi:hypothetical protein
LPDWAKEKPKGADAAAGPAPMAKSLLAEQLHAFMGKCSSREDEIKVKKLMEAAPRTFNMFHLKALDWGMRGGLNIALSYFKPPRPVNLLTSSLVRYYVDLGISGDELAQGAPGLKRRSCIEDKASGERWFEVPRERDGQGNLHRPALHVVTDKGPKCFPGLQYLFKKLRLRGSLIADPWHQDWNGLRSAAAEAGLWGICLERCIVHNFPSGPWEGCAAHQSVKGAGKHFFETSDEHNDLFSLVFERLSMAFGDIPMDFGSHRHRKQVWDRCKEAGCMKNKGASVRMGRWYDLFAKESDLEPGHSEVLLLILLYMGMRDNWWTSVMQCPLFTMGMPPHVRDEAAAAAGLGEEVQVAAERVATLSRAGSVSQSNKELQKLRGSSHNTKEVVCKILACPMRSRLWQAVQHMVVAMRKSFGDWQSRCKTSRSTLHLHMSWSLGVENLKIMEEIFRCLRGGENFNLIGFASPASAPEPAIRAQLEEDTLVATKMFRFALRLVAHRSYLTMHYTHGLPLMFVQLLHDEPVVVSRCLRNLELLWKALQEGQHLAIGDSWVKGVLEGAWWPTDVFVLETLIILSECSFAMVPQEVSHSLTWYFSGLLSTNACEEAMNLLRKREDSNRRKMLGARARWHVLHSSTLLQEYGRAQPPETTASRAMAAKSLPKSIFTADGVDFSCGQAELEGLSDTSWTSSNAATWNLYPYFTASLLLLEGDWQSVRLCWQSLYLDFGLVIKRVAGEAQMSYLVLDVTIWGCLVWELRGTRGGGQTYFNFVPASAEHCPCYILPLVEPKAWKVFDTKVLPPSAVAGGRSKDMAAGVIFTSAGSPGVSVLHWAANRAFNNLTNTYLKQAWVANSVAGPVPTREADLLEGLVRHSLPGVSQDDLNAILALRGKAGNTQRQEPDQDVCTIFEEDPAAAQAAEELLDPSDKQELETVKKLVAKKLKIVQLATAGSTGGASSSSGSGAVRLKALPVLHSMTLRQARALAPVAKGCLVSKESRWHNRWCGEYLQRSSGSKYHKRTFSDPVSEAVALKGVLAWLWSVHTECTGQASPYLFD